MRTDARRSVDSGRAKCPACGGRLRPGSVYGGKELTMVFQDNEEERFVQALACGGCRQVRLVVDYDTDVEE
jgi:hypothetical protein